MSLSMAALFAPLSEFFVEKLGSQPGAAVQFRFDALGSVISDADFIDENHPDLGYLPALAIEKFSDLVNRAPVDCGDGLNIQLGQTSIDDTYYYRLLAPSVVDIPPDAGADAEEALRSTFVAEKAAALKLWEAVELTSMSGLVLNYKPSYATPEDWYDAHNDASWTSQTFNITEPARQPDAPAPAVAQWRLLPSDELLAKVVAKVVVEPPPVDVPVAEHDPSQPGPDPEVVNLRNQLKVLRAQPEVADQLMLPAAQRQVLRPAGDVKRLTLNTQALEAAAGGPANRITLVAQQGAAKSVAVDSTRVRRAPLVTGAFDRHIAALDVRDRLLVRNIVAPQAPTAPATTSSISVSFDYCVVRINRRWLMNVFLTGPGWAVPGTARGSVSEPGSIGSLSALPVAMVAVRNLTITADWSADDIAASTGAMQFGPFAVDPAGIVDGSISHPSLQTVGWLVEQLPELPPGGTRPTHT